MVSGKRVVLFDLDGVIALTEPLKVEAHSSTIRQLGGVVPDDLYGKVIGYPHDVVRAAFLEASNIQVDPELYTRIYRETYDKLLDTKLKIRAGIHELIRTLRKNGYALAIVSSTARSSMTKILKSGGLGQAFDTYISADDVREKKPNPEAYLLALKRLNIQPENGVIFEDSKAGIQAARQAGIAVIGVSHDYSKEHDFDGTIRVINSFANPSEIMELIEYSFDR